MTARHLCVDKPCISLRERVDNKKTVTHAYAPLAHTPVENPCQDITPPDALRLSNQV
jgi:hypothetical protein